jgi:hypothetical protein
MPKSLEQRFARARLLQRIQAVERQMSACQTADETWERLKDKRAALLRDARAHQAKDGR